MICASPAVDLEPTALRAARLASLLIAALILAGAAVLARYKLALRSIAIAFVPTRRLLKSADVIDLNCTLLC